MTFVIHALPDTVLDDLRQGRWARPVHHLSAGGGEPVRCCLRDAGPGEELVLFNYRPPLPASPYQETGAVYAHARPCAGRPSTDTYPAAWYGRPQVLRAYDARGWIHPGTRVHDGTAPEHTIAEILADPDVVAIHSRNIAYGCFMFAVTRAS